jgi:hypothetical protein
MEIWKKAKGYEDYISISSNGNIYSIRKNKRIKPINNGNGYMRINLSNFYYDGVLIKQRTLYIHRLVAEAFIVNKKEQVNHKDEDKNNNNLYNLEWCDAKYNSNYGNRNEKLSKIKKKSVMQINKNGSIVKEWNSIGDASYFYTKNKYHSSINNVLRKRSKKAFGFYWSYCEIN